jgi:NAD(P)-dependent dehydrogenase (short-subunit alcohol dehydrogenase family)
MSSDQTDLGRRGFVGGIGAGIVVGMATPVSAQQTGAAASVGGEPTPLTNPVNDYPKPPFPKQQQEWPGLTSRMDPRPDHGEKTYEGSGRLAGRKALITGGDSGIGRAAAIAFAREGADVAFNYLPQEEPDAKEVVQQIRDAGRKAVPIAGDLRDEKFCNKLVQDAVRDLGGLDILVNNAARQYSVDDLAKITTEQLDDTFKTNVYAMFWLTKAALPHLPPGSCIINTTSVTAYDPPPNLIDYSVTKAAIMNFTKSLAKQLIERGIRVNAVAPGPIWTPLQPSGGQPPEKLPQFGADTPMGRPGQPAELAPIYVLLASAESSYSTGQVFGAVGGRGGP